MKYKVLLLLSLLIGCAPLERPKVDYDKGWIIEKDGTRHFYKDRIVLGEEIFCLIHQEKEIIFVIKKLDRSNDIK